MATFKPSRTSIKVVVLAFFGIFMVIFYSMQNRYLTAISPESAADAIKSSWGAIDITPDSLRLGRAQSSGNSVSVIYMASTASGDYKFAFIRDESTEVRLLQVLKTAPFAQDVVVWDYKKSPK